jgi:hypothetical protein
VDHIKELALAKIKAVDRWSSATKGTLLQIRMSETPAVGVRCNFKVANGTLEAIAIVSGDAVGTILFESDFLGPALDVSESVEVVARELGPFSHRPRLLPRELLVQYDGEFYLWVEVMTGTGAGFIRIADGEYFMGLPQQDPQINIAASVGIRLIEKKEAAN